MALGLVHLPMPPMPDGLPPAAKSSVEERQIRADRRMTLQGAIEAVLAEGLVCASAAFPCNRVAELAERIVREVERRVPARGETLTIDDEARRSPLRRLGE